MHRSRVGISLLMSLSLGMGGCDPLFDVGGAYLPGWLFAALLALGLTFLVRWILVLCRVDEFLWLKSVAYISLFTAFALSLWFFFFRY